MKAKGKETDRRILRRRIESDMKRMNIAWKQLERGGWDSWLEDPGWRSMLQGCV